MLFNGKKFEMLRYGPNNDLKNSTNYLTPEYEDLIEEKESLRDLGVIMSDDASFSRHVHHVCSKVKQKAGWILRTFQTRNTQVMKFLWKSLIQWYTQIRTENPRTTTFRLLGKAKGPPHVLTAEAHGEI